MKKSILITIAILIVASLIVWSAIYFISKDKTKTGPEKKSKDELEKLVNLAYPKPPEKISDLAGNIKEIYGATIHFEINDPNDYLPHTDGTPPKKEIRFVSVSKTTKIILVDTTKLDANEYPKTTDMKFTDLKTGMNIIVSSNQNIKDAEKFDATQIQLIKY